MPLGYLKYDNNYDNSNTLVHLLMIMILYLWQLAQWRKQNI
jgi:hypothetical protein